MRKQSIWICLLLIVGHFLTETSTLLYKYYPEVDNMTFNRWIDRKYVWYGLPEGINLKWFIKLVTDDLLMLIISVALVLVTKKFSYRLYLASCTFLAYHLIDAFMLWYNYKTSAWIYWMLNAVICISIVYLFIPEKRQGKIKYME